MLTSAPAGLSYVDFRKGNGETIFAHACAMGIEGIVSRGGEPVGRDSKSD
jgi:hypothetical protein